MKHPLSSLNTLSHRRLITDHPTIHVCMFRIGVGTVAGVEVSIDGGKSWRQARWTPGMGTAQGPGLGTAQNQGLGPGQVSGLGPVLRPGYKRMWERAFPLWPMPLEEDPLLCPHTDTYTRMLYQVMIMVVTVTIIIGDDDRVCYYY